MKNKEFNAEGLNPIYKELYEIVGEDNMNKLYKQYKGQQLTFPTRLYNREYIKELLFKEYDGSNIRELSRKVGYSERWIRKLLKDGEL